MYLVDRPDYQTVAYTKNQLLPVDKDKIIAPDNKYIKGTPEYYIIEKILDKKRNRTYLVKWKGFPENESTWISSTELERTKDLKEMKKEFDKEFEKQLNN
jgi:hypothetical protein